MRNLWFVFCVICVFGVSSPLCALSGSAQPETIPVVPESILGQGRLDAAQMTDMLLAANPDLDPDFAREFTALYRREAAVEGVNHDVAFAQMCLETNFLTFDGMVSADSNNFGGIGVVSAAQPGERFGSILLGVRAQIQHLKAYATTAPLAQSQVDPRYHTILQSGKAPLIYDLAGFWSVDLAYGDKLKSLMERFYTVAFGPAPQRPATIGAAFSR